MKGNMNTITKTQVRLFASSRSWIAGEALRQFYAAANLEGVRIAAGFPDLHPGSGTPVGAAFVTESVIYPHLIGSDIGCGMALFKTGLSRRDAKLDRWAEMYFHLEHPWDEDVSEVLAAAGLESTEFDADLGTIGGGNHFAEIQAVESGQIDKLNNPLKQAPHTAQAVTADKWDRPYTREQAAYPAPWLREHKFWPSVGRIDNVFGDRNPICSCAGMEAHPGA